MKNDLLAVRARLSFWFYIPLFVLLLLVTVPIQSIEIVFKLFPGYVILHIGIEFGVPLRVHALHQHFPAFG
jgi:hypothetical protein